MTQTNVTASGTRLRGVVAEGADREAISQLAARFGSAPPEGAVLAAEVNGKLIAAIGIADGHAIIDHARTSLALRARLHLERLYVRLVFALGGSPDQRNARP
jgi:hypothetical protein